MKVGDLVRRKHTHQVGVVTNSANPKPSGKMQMLRVHWFTLGETDGWFGAHKLEVISEDR
jgi:hypothetical protein